MSANSPKRSNPSVGLGLWGPLVPSSDCTPCLATLASLQLGAGALLWIKPGRNPPPHRSVFRNRITKLAGILAGSALILMSGLEFTRLSLPYDPWREDAKKARESYVDRTKFGVAENTNWFSPQFWRFYWFGAPDHRPVGWETWKKRTKDFLNRSGTVREELETVFRVHQALVAANRDAASHILDLINRNALPAPEIPVEELEALAAQPDFGLGEGDELFDQISLDNSDMWSFFQKADPFCFVTIPRSTTAYLPGVEVSDADLAPQLVEYMPVPQAVKTSFR